MRTRSLWWRHAPDAVARHRSPLHLNGCCRVAHLFRCSGSPSQRNSHRPHRCWRGDEVRLASAQFGVRPAIRYRSSELATQSRPILRLPAIVLSSAASCLWKSFRRSRTPFRDRPETVRLHRGTGVRLHPGILFEIIPECRSESSRNRVHLAPDSPMLDRHCKVNHIGCRRRA